MYLLDILGVIIGLVFVWMLLSVAVEQIQEWLVGWLGIRGDTLADAIWGMLENPRKRAGPWGRFVQQIQKFFQRRGWLQNHKRFAPEALPDLVKEFYSHPLISELSQGSELSRGEDLTTKTSFPSYIPADTFARALFETIMTAGTDESVLKKVVNHLEKNLPELVADAVQTSVRLSLQNIGNLAEEAAKKHKKTKELDEAVDEFRTRYAEFADLYNEAFQTELGENPTDMERVGAIQKVMAELEKTLPLSNEAKEALQTATSLLQNLSSVSGENQGVTLQAGIEQLKVAYPEQAKFINAAIQAELPNTANGFLDQLESGAVNLMVTNPKLTYVLEGIVKEARTQTNKAEKQIVAARTGVEKWFNDTMDRTSGWYKRNRQVGAFVIALILALILNVDTVAIGTELWRDPLLREAVVEAAVEKVEEEQSEEQSDDNTPPASPRVPVEDLQGELAKLNIPFGWQIEAPSVSDNGKQCEEGSSKLNEDDSSQLVIRVPNPIPIVEYQENNQINSLKWQAWTCLHSYSPYPNEWSGWAKLAGILITAFAGMQGGPFWFDILQKLVNMRAAGKKPDEN